MWRRDGLLVDPVGARHQQQVGLARLGAAEHQRLDDLAHGAAAGRRRLLGRARALRHVPDLAVRGPWPRIASCTRWAAGFSSLMLIVPPWHCFARGAVAPCRPRRYECSAHR